MQRRHRRLGSVIYIQPVQDAVDVPLHCAFDGAQHARNLFVAEALHD
jgi:hypothetical protein